MIVFDLRCAGGHVFEAWFGSSGAFEEQRERRLVACPICADATIEKAVMAPNVAAKGNRAAAMPDPKAAIARIAAAQAHALKDSRWVGPRFAAEARAIHNGERAEGVIHGQATAAEVSALLDDGVPVAPLLVPVVPPETIN